MRLLIIILVGLMLFLSAILYFGQKSLNLPVNQAGFGKSVSPIGKPVRLKIPVINVDASIEYVGLTANGEMVAPEGPANVAWYQLGPRPGENGSAVMAGHYGTWKNGQGSVFDNLNKLKKGDILYVEDGKGATIFFVVRESRSYDPNADASSVFNFNDGKSHLNLVTCEGVWDNISKTYSQRLVVFTDKKIGQ